MQNDYNFISRALHRIVLGNDFIGQTCFDIETQFNKFRRISRKTSAPVFISGLARAGTTILMRSLYETQEFSSLNYRDMPFILMPGLWSKISWPFHKYAVKKERSHNDGIFIDNDSPEAFEEVFWKSYSKGQYISEKGLRSYTISKDLEEKFKQFVLNALSSSSEDKCLRYLSKNNNNLLRLASLKSTFPNAVIIVPYRNPVQQAASLYRQHILYTEMHKGNSFSANYMDWLGHYEFGQNHKPFLFSSPDYKTPAFPTEDPNYWLNYWCEVYGYLFENAPEGTIFFSYDDFCKDPAEALSNLAEKIGVDKAKFQTSQESIAKKSDHEFVPDRILMSKANLIYKSLNKRVS